MRPMKALRLILPAIVIAGVVLIAGELSSSLINEGHSKAHSPAATIRLTIEANGDLLIHSPVYNRALENGGGTTYNFNPMLAYIKPIIKRADLAVCHVEVPMTSAPLSGYPLFNSPPALADAIVKTGWNACDSASNHTLDQGQTGVDQTIENLDRAGVAHTGSYASAAAASKPLIINVHGVRIAWLAYTEMTNGIPLPNPWTVNIASAPKILAEAARARASGAQVVIVNIHAGEEYQHEPSANQLSLANRLTASPLITAVVGQHVHVVQPIRWLNGKPVVFGEGNLLSNQTLSCCPKESQDGYMALLHVKVKGTQSSVERVDYVPVWVRHPDFAVLPVGVALRKGLASSAELQASWDRTTSVVGRGATLKPL